VKNPKSEVRRSKEGRRSKAEQVGSIEGNHDEPLAWPSEANTGAYCLNDGGTAAPHGVSNLAERTALVGEAIVRFARKIPNSPVNNRLIDQLVGAGTSVGANYCEADDAVSGKEFKLRIGTCRKESKETMFFLRMIAAAREDLAVEARLLWREAKELNLIFGAIWRKM